MSAHEHDALAAALRGLGRSRSLGPARDASDGGVAGPTGPTGPDGPAALGLDRLVDAWRAEAPRRPAGPFGARAGLGALAALAIGSAALPPSPADVRLGPALARGVQALVDGLRGAEEGPR